MVAPGLEVSCEVAFQTSEAADAHSFFSVGGFFSGVCDMRLYQPTYWAPEATGLGLFVLLLSTLVCCQPTELILVSNITPPPPQVRANSSVIRIPCHALLPTPVVSFNPIVDFASISKGQVGVVPKKTITRGCNDNSSSGAGM